MNLYECPRIDDAAGYVLRALPDSEAESYRHHITECTECEGKVAELTFVSHALYSAAPQLSAPPEIFDRVMVVVRAESELLQAAGAGADRPVRSAERRSWLGFGLGRLRPVTAGALAAVLLALGLGIGTMLRGSDGACTTRPVTVDRAAGATASGQLKVCDGSARLALAGMQSPPPGRIYQVWLDDPADREGPQPGGLFSVRKGKASVDVGDVKGGKVVLVTDEPLEGSEVPTRTPVLKATT